MSNFLCSMNNKREESINVLCVASWFAEKHLWTNETRRTRLLLFLPASVVEVAASGKGVAPGFLFVPGDELFHAVFDGCFWRVAEKGVCFVDIGVCFLNFGERVFVDD